MNQPAEKTDGQLACEQALGYLNFSSGAADPQFLANLNRLYRLAPKGRSTSLPTWRRVVDWLRRELDRLAGASAAFADVEQARLVLTLVADRAVPDYFAFHRDLLFHQEPGRLVNAFFLGRVCEAVLAEGAPWNEADRIVAGAIGRLNDYLGHRPVATLESQKIEPYAHERVRPVPLFVRGAGAAYGPYHAVVELTLELLRTTDDDLLRSIHFDPELLDELAYDPRAYDFDHPVNKRPNYHFGQWDPHHLDNQGRYRRFVVQQVTLDALLERTRSVKDLPAEELLLEAAAVLSGTILMASGISGWGPGAHDSDASLATLLPGIAATRDAFYERLIARLSGGHAARLKREAAERRQPFGGARQHLNALLAKRRASQLEHVHLAKAFARMGYPEAAMEESNIVPAASARMICRIDCRLATAGRAIRRGELEHAADQLAEAVEILHRAIECGAVIDPWNLLGFDGQFSLFPALENSVRDHRADELCDLMEQVFAAYAHAWSEAAARDDAALRERLARDFESLARWWHRFAAHEVEAVGAIDAVDAFHAAEHVAAALHLWHRGGAAAGDVKFWAPHAEMFDSPRAYALVIDALLDRGDFVASMALLVHWLSQAERVGLEKGDSSLHELAEMWLRRLRERTVDTPAAAPPQPWSLVRKFLDYLEANGDEYWRVPDFELGARAGGRRRTGGETTPEPRSDQPAGELAADEEDSDDDGENLFGAAYEDMVYRDSTADGVEGDIIEGGSASDAELEAEARRLDERLAFLSTLARLWRLAALFPLETPGAHVAATLSADQAADTLLRWRLQADVHRAALHNLLDAVHAYPLPTPGGDHESLVEYDRRRSLKESLLERIIGTIVETADAARYLLARAAALAGGPETQSAVEAIFDKLPSDRRRTIDLFSAVLRGDARWVSANWREMLQALASKPLLYVPLARGGEPSGIVAARVRQHAIADFLASLPRIGLIVETCQLIETARKMERDHPVGPGAVTEFDDLYKIGYRALVEHLVTAAQAWREPPTRKSEEESREGALVSCLDQLTQSLLIIWLAHSRTLRLSVLEKVQDSRSWERLVKFVQRYGGEIFTQRFLNPGNLRSILHQGVDAWLTQLAEDPRLAGSFRLLDELDGAVARTEAVEMLSLILEAILENYGEYRDYNSTTTQSDHGEHLYMLLDFLRLRTQYDHFAWKLKPVVLAHEILVRRGQNDAARMWRRAFTDRVSEEADRYLDRLSKLQKKYAIRMPTVADRLCERFVRPMVIDRTRALVAPAVLGAGREPPPVEFELLREETQLLTREPTGVGLDVPVWLAALEEEVDNVTRRRVPSERTPDLDAIIPPQPLSFEQVQEQLGQWLPEQ